MGLCGRLCASVAAAGRSFPQAAPPRRCMRDICSFASVGAPTFLVSDVHFRAAQVAAITIVHHSPRATLARRAHHPRFTMTTSTRRSAVRLAAISLLIRLTSAASPTFASTQSNQVTTVGCTMANDGIVSVVGLQRFTLPDGTRHIGCFCDVRAPTP
jgi:hypothetical protein